MSFIFRILNPTNEMNTIYYYQSLKLLNLLLERLIFTKVESCSHTQLIILTIEMNIYVSITMKRCEEFDLGTLIYSHFLGRR